MAEEAAALSFKSRLGLSNSFPVTSNPSAVEKDITAKTAKALPTGTGKH